MNSIVTVNVRVPSLEERRSEAKMSEPWAKPNTPALLANSKDWSPEEWVLWTAAVINAWSAFHVDVNERVPEPSVLHLSVGLAKSFAASSVNPASDSPEIGEAWPKDTLHDAARQVIKGARDLAPGARQGVRGAMDKADAPPTGRAATDGALGRALGSKHSAYGVRAGV